jgi:hypothetical protein
MVGDVDGDHLAVTDPVQQVAEVQRAAAHEGAGLDDQGGLQPVGNDDAGRESTGRGWLGSRV